MSLKPSSILYLVLLSLHYHTILKSSSFLLHCFDNVQATVTTAAAYKLSLFSYLEVHFLHSMQISFKRQRKLPLYLQPFSSSLNNEIQTPYWVQVHTCHYIFSSLIPLLLVPTSPKTTVSVSFQLLSSCPQYSSHNCFSCFSIKVTST